MLQYIVLCILFLGVPAVLLIREIRFVLLSRRCTEQVEGTVVRLEEHWMFDRRSRSTFKPVVAYTYNGLRWESTTFYKFTYDTYSVNLPVKVWVDPADPEHILLARERDKAKTSIIGSAVLILVMAGLLAYANAELIEQRERQDAMSAAIAEMQAELAAGNEDAFEEFIDENIVRVVNGGTIAIQ
ncbi:MAG: DUF3592 domain-containing protein [Clostridia bacterium]|nr:DUF3592 domain-containing protein [Clostridia bacterium]